MNIEEIMNATTARNEEYFDGFVVVGFIHGNNEPIIIRKARDPKDYMALNGLLQAALSIPLKEEESS